MAEGWLFKEPRCAGHPDPLGLLTSLCLLPALPPQGLDSRQESRASVRVSRNNVSRALGQTAWKMRVLGPFTPPR